MPRRCSPRATSSTRAGSILYKGFITLFQQGLASEPGNGLAHFYLAESHYKLGELAPALDHYKQAADLLPDGEDATRARNLAVAIEAELGAGSGTTSGTTSSGTSSSSATGGSVDWGDLVASDAGVSAAIKDFYNTTHPVSYVSRSKIEGVYEMVLESATPTEAIVGFRCLVANPGDRGKFFRARATLEADGSGFRVIAFNPREKFNLQKVGVF